MPHRQKETDDLMKGVQEDCENIRLWLAVVQVHIGNKAVEKVVGSIAIRHKSEEPDSTLYIKRFKVHPAFRRLGIGCALLDYAVKVAKTLHYKRVELRTDEYMKAAIFLYEKYGFRRVLDRPYKLFELGFVRPRLYNYALDV